MSVWHVIGLATDHTSSIRKIIKDYVSSNWTLTGELSTSHVAFGTRWYDKQNQFQVHFRGDIQKDVKQITLGNRSINQFPDLVYAHSFAEEQADKEEPTNIDKMNREIQRIIGSDRVALEASQGICDLTIDSTARMLPAEAITSQSTVYHSVMRIRCIYRKVFS